MNEIMTQKGLELEALSPGDIVTAMPRDPKLCSSAIYRVIASNVSCVVVERADGAFQGRREVLQMNRYRWFEASELLDALTKS